MVGHINTISKQATTCTLITNLGEKKEVGGLNFFFFYQNFHFQIFPGPSPTFGRHQSLFGIFAFPGTI